MRFGTIGIGYLNREMAARLAPNFDAGERYTATVKHVTGGGTRSVGVNIWVERARGADRAPARRRARAQRRGAARRCSATAPAARAQRAFSNGIAAGKNTLAVFGTGRGKSLCFQYPAAVGALERGEKTIVLYPLRALANDQYDALVRRLEPLGLRIFRANGAIDAGERADADGRARRRARGTSSARRRSSCTSTSSASRTTHSRPALARRRRSAPLRRKHAPPGLRPASATSSRRSARRKSGAHRDGRRRRVRRGSGASSAIEAWVDRPDGAREPHGHRRAR